MFPIPHVLLYYAIFFGLVRDWPLPAFVKFALILTGVTGVLLVIYRYAVRYTWLGRLLNGPRARPSQPFSRPGPVPTSPAASG